MKRCDILSFILALEVNAVNSVCGVYSWMEKGILGGKIRRMKLYLVRHGETDWNKVKRIQGQVDIPLNQFGKRLAEETAEGMKEIPFDLCITSPLSRARQTAEIVLGGRKVPIIEDARIEELSFGSWEGIGCRPEWHLVNMKENAVQEITGNSRRIFTNFLMIRQDSYLGKAENHLLM